MSLVMQSEEIEVLEAVGSRLRKIFFRGILMCEVTHREFRAFLDMVSRRLEK